MMMYLCLKAAIIDILYECRFVDDLNVVCFFCFCFFLSIVTKYCSIYPRNLSGRVGLNVILYPSSLH